MGIIKNGESMRLSHYSNFSVFDLFGIFRTPLLVCVFSHYPRRVIPSIRNNLHLGCVKAPRIDDRRLAANSPVLFNTREFTIVDFRELSRDPKYRLFLIEGINPEGRSKSAQKSLKTFRVCLQLRIRRFWGLF